MLSLFSFVFFVAEHWAVPAPLTHNKQEDKLNKLFLRTSKATPIILWLSGPQPRMMDLLLLLVWLAAPTIGGLGAPLFNSAKEEVAGELLSLIPLNKFNFINSPTHPFFLCFVASLSFFIGFFLLSFPLVCLGWFASLVAEHWLAHQPITPNKLTTPNQRKRKNQSAPQQSNPFIVRGNEGGNELELLLWFGLGCSLCFIVHSFRQLARLLCGLVAWGWAPANNPQKRRAIELTPFILNTQRAPRPQQSKLIKSIHSQRIDLN